jgi:uncharacterized protein YhaN
MRFRQLDLIAFGHFTDLSIDLSQGNYGLHLIYGPNEAGKSTSLRALTALLFNFPHRTDDNFKHENRNLRVGATLENRDGKRLSCVRRKARSLTLLHANSSEEVKAELWSQFFPRIQEEQFLRMFAMNHITLRDGGADLVRGGGDSGQALFSSASGIANLQQKRVRLDQQIEGIYSNSGRKGRLLEKLKEYKEIRDEEKKVALTMDQYLGYESQLLEARNQAKDCKNRLDSLQKRLLELERLQRSIPTVRSYLERQKQLAELGQSSKLPEDFEARVQKVCQAKGEKAGSIESIRTEISNIAQKLSQIPDRDWDQEQALRVDKLILGLGLYEQWRVELPKLQMQRDELKAQAAKIWQQIGSLERLKTRLESEPIATSQKKLIEAQARRYENLDRQITDSRRGLARLQNRLDSNTDSLAEQPSQETLERLEQRVQVARAIASRQLEMQELEQGLQILQKRIEQGLGKWSVAVDSIDALTDWTLASPAALDRWNKEFDKRLDGIERTKSDLEGLIRNRSAKQRELERESRKVQVPTRQEWETSRRARDEAFRLLAEHRDGTTELWSAFASDYEQSKVDADEIAAKLLDQAELVAQREQLQQVVDELQAQVEESNRTLENQQAEHAANQRAWQAFAAEHRIASKTPDEAIEWVQAVAQLQRDAQDLLDKKHRVEQTRVARDAAASGLKQILETCTSAGVPSEDFESLLTLAESVLRTATQQRGKAEAIHKQRQLDQQEHQEKLHEIQALEKEFEELQTQWWESLGSIALPHNATPLEVQTILEQIGELQKTTDSIEKIQESIRICKEQMQRYEAALELATAWLSDRDPAAIAQRVAQGSIEGQVRFLEHYGKQVLQDRSNRVSLDQMQQHATDRLGQAEQELTLLTKQLEQMMEFANADSEERLLELARNSSKFHLLDKDRKQLRERLQDECNRRDIDDFVETVRQADADQLVIEITDATEEIAKTGLAREEAIKRCSGLERDYQNLDTGGKASALATQASGIACEIEEALAELATLRLASAALTAGIERYRSANEDPILKLASESFRQMTLGRFRGIEIALDEDGKHLLVGRREGEGPGSQVLVEQMSDGTRDQLYLALRLASLQQWNTVHEPLPLVVDDILVHFDDDRSIEALKQLVRLSDQTQVIFFTHHQHLIELATSRLASEKVFLHHLDSA